jgi:hypothetical protein
MGMPLAGVGRFRFSAMRQRGSYAAVIRFISADIPSLGQLGGAPDLGELIMEKRGLLLMVGATGAGKSTTLASMMDYRNERRPATSSPSKTRLNFCSRTRSRWSTSARWAPTPSRMHRWRCERSAPGAGRDPDR